jgi:hypothetical protein
MASKPIEAGTATDLGNTVEAGTAAEAGTRPKACFIYSEASEDR